MIHKYGLPLTDSDWSGLPMRVGHFPSAGRVEDLSSASDAVLLWTGATSHVDIAYRDGGDAIRERRFARRSGMIDILPATVSIDRIRWRNDGVGSSCISVTFPRRSLGQLLGANGNPPLEHVGAQFALSDPHAADLISRLHAQVVAGNPLGAAYSQGVSLTLAAYLFARYDRTGRADAAPSTPERLPRIGSEALMVFIEDSLSQNIGIVDMAAVVGYSPDHFSRLFRQTFRVSPYQYLLGRRVERAKGMLRDATLPIATIALACGFSSQSHLNVVFKRMLGVTPARYRRG